ncbi:hypothetical protein RRG08_017359 [Elysia crispata]|uniref:Uncharacterized protein n=1 Tax=Elysia crispata TaxID=231223 RepID=A0AAE1ALD4_9GAST|nr:hypothetical protein RRG08_017359 [Elysia crispata]
MQRVVSTDRKEYNIKTVEKYLKLQADFESLLL